MDGDFLERLRLCANESVEAGIPMSEFIDANLRPIVERVVSSVLTMGDAPDWLSADTHTITILCSWARGYAVYETWPVDAPLFGGAVRRALKKAADCVRGGYLPDASVAEACAYYLWPSTIPIRVVDVLSDAVSEIAVTIGEAYLAHE